MKKKNRFTILPIILIIVSLIFLIFMLYKWEDAAEKDFRQFKNIRNNAIRVDGYLYAIHPIPHRHKKMYSLTFSFEFNKQTYFTKGHDINESVYSEKFIINCLKNRNIPKKTIIQDLYIDKNNTNLVILYNPIGMSYWGWYKKSAYSGILPISLFLVFFSIFAIYAKSLPNRHLESRGIKKKKVRKNQ